MAWAGIKQWFANMIVSADDFNRIEGNTLDNHERLNEHNSRISSNTNRLNGHMSDGTQHAKTVRFVIGTSTAGWTEKDCDYLCDGTNDQVEINNAIAALPASGGEIVILDGTYNITAPISVNKDNVSIRGNGNATVLKRMWNSSSPEGVITLSSVQGCRIENLQIDGNKAIYTANNNCGIHLYLSSNNTITGNTCKDNTYGIYLSSSSNNTLTSNICNNNYGNGIRLYSSSDNTITGNICNNNGDGIHIRESSNDNTITGNSCNNNNNYSIYLILADNNTITGNTCKDNNHGIYLYTSSNNNTVTGNTCYNNNYGILLSTSSNNNTVTGNTCNNNDVGIDLHTCNNNTVTGNNCKDNNYGIYLYDSSRNTVTGNTCIRGTGTPEDYTISQYTIQLNGSNTYHNLISSNNCMGHPVATSGGYNSAWGNKYSNTDDLP